MGGWGADLTSTILRARQLCWLPLSPGRKCQGLGVAVRWMLRGMLCVPFSCRQGLGICMPEGHGCNAGPQSSGARLRRDKVKKPSTSALSQKAASQAWRAWEDMGEADRTPRASHLFLSQYHQEQEPPASLGQMLQLRLSRAALGSTFRSMAHPAVSI